MAQLAAATAAARAQRRPASIAQLPASSSFPSVSSAHPVLHGVGAAVLSGSVPPARGGNSVDQRLRSSAWLQLVSVRDLTAPLQLALQQQGQRQGQQGHVQQGQQRQRARGGRQPVRPVRADPRRGACCGWSWRTDGVITTTLDLPAVEFSAASPAATPISNERARDRCPWLKEVNIWESRCMKSETGRGASSKPRAR